MTVRVIDGQPTMTTPNVVAGLSASISHYPGTQFKLERRRFNRSHQPVGEWSNESVGIDVHFEAPAPNPGWIDLSNYLGLEAGMSPHDVEDAIGAASARSRPYKQLDGTPSFEQYHLRPSRAALALWGSADPEFDRRIPNPAISLRRSSANLAW